MTFIGVIVNDCIANEGPPTEGLKETKAVDCRFILQTKVNRLSWSVGLRDRESDGIVGRLYPTGYENR
jgi:hypothetical protein